MPIKYCLNSQCGKTIIAKADEVKLTSNDDLLYASQDYPNTTLLLPYPDFTLPNGINLGNIEKVIKQPVVFYLDDLRHVPILQKYNLKWFYDRPVTTFVEFNRLLDLSVWSIVIDCPLFNNLAYVNEIAPAGGIRFSPNVSYYATIPSRNGLIGKWVRPEDVKTLESYNITLFFENCEGNNRKEEALFRVYQEGEWKGDINNIITNMNYGADNQLIDPTLIEKRINCGQRCQSGGSCHLCYRHFKIASKDFVKEARKLS